LPYPVEPQVFNLIYYLIQHASRVVTRDELIESLWGGRIVSDAALSTRIKSARKAIGDDGEQQRLIKTIHGRGFRFVGDIATEEQPEPAAAESAPSASKEGIRQDIRFTVTRNGVRLGYSTAGAGPMLVRTANWMTHLEFDWESPVWQHWMTEFA